MAFDDKNLYFLFLSWLLFPKSVISLSPIVILINSLWLKATVLPFFPDLWQCCELSPFVIWLLFSYIGPLNSRLAPENVGKYPAGGLRGRPATRGQKHDACLFFINTKISNFSIILHIYLYALLVHYYRNYICTYPQLKEDMFFYSLSSWLKAFILMYILRY